VHTKDLPKKYRLEFYSDLDADNRPVKKAEVETKITIPFKNKEDC